MARNGVGILQAEVCVGLILVVLEDIYNGQLPDSRHVQRFEERALLGCPISKKAVHDLPRFLHLRCQRGSSRMRNALPNNSGSAREMARWIRQVHRPAKATAESVLAAKNFRHHRSHRRSEHDRIALTTIARHHKICFVTRRKSSHDAAFGSITKMRVPADDSWVLDERPLDRLLELTDSHHLRVHPYHSIFANHVWHGDSSQIL